MGAERARHTRERLQAMTPMGSSAPQDLAEVYRTTYRALVRFLYRKVWDAERAEDLAQEAFARALVHKPANARGWLFVVAANMARDDARRAARERRHLTLLKSEHRRALRRRTRRCTRKANTRRCAPRSSSSRHAIAKCCSCGIRDCRTTRSPRRRD